MNEIVKEVIHAWPGQVAIIGRPCHSQSQELVEKGNLLVEMQLQSKRSEWKGIRKCYLGRLATTN